MKFGIKVLVANLIVISISLGIVGFFVLNKNFNLSKNQAILSATEENNMVQSSVEYEIIQDAHSGSIKDPDNYFSKIGQKVSQGIILSYTSIYIYYDESYRYTSDKEYYNIPEDILLSETAIDKNYIIKEEDGRHYIYTSSVGTYDNKKLCVITKKNITEIYDNLNQSIAFFRTVLFLVLIGTAVLMVFISILLTKPLGKLNSATKEIAAGNYKARTDVKTKDEVGELSESFNEMAEKIDEKVVELQDMVKRRDQFVADFAHEIKTPMTSIIGYAYTMKNSELSQSEQDMALNYIYSEGKRMEAMGQSLFDLIYLRQNEIELEEVNTEELFDEIGRIVRPMLDKKNIELKTAIVPAVIGANKELFTTVFVNLIDNARKASKEGSVIECAGDFYEEGYKFSIKDYGFGMSPETVSRITDEFYMADKTRTRKEGGAGLGMSIVQSIVTAHKAKLIIESELNKGTTMSIIMPDVQSVLSESGGVDE